MAATNNFIFILFPPATGGNHLANLLSICFRIDKRVPANKDDLIKVYDNTTVHCARSNLQIASVKQVFSQLGKEDTVLCGHIGEYLRERRFFDHLKNKQFITFTWDIFKSPIHRILPRLELLNDGHDYTPLKTLYYQEEQSFIYRAENIARLVERDVVEIILDDFLSSDIIPVLTKLGNVLGYEVYDLELCQELHVTWLTNNKII
jgi:hypothetical protein